MANNDTEILKKLDSITSKLDIAIGVQDPYKQAEAALEEHNAKLQEEKKAKAEVQEPNPVLTSKQKLFHENIAKQFEKVLGVHALKHILEKLNNTFNLQREEAKEKEKTSHVREAKPTEKKTEKLKTKESESTGGILGWIKSLLSGIGIGSILSMIGMSGLAGLAGMKLGPATGIIQFISKYASMLGAKFLTSAATKIIELIVSPFKFLIESFTGDLSKTLEKQGEKVGAGFLAKKFPLLFKFFGKSLKVLKKLPFGLGALISFYFAYDRFNEGDMTGGCLELASGIASIFPGVGTAISIGLDMLNAYRDLSGTTAKEVKSNDMSGWLSEKIKVMQKELTDKFSDNLIFGPWIKAFNAFQKSNWADGLKELGLGSVAAFFESKSVSPPIKQSNVDISNKLGQHIEKKSIVAPLHSAADKINKGDVDAGLADLNLGWLRSVGDNSIDTSNTAAKINENIRLKIESIYKIVDTKVNSFLDDISKQVSSINIGKINFVDNFNKQLASINISGINFVDNISKYTEKVFDETLKTVTSQATDAVSLAKKIAPNLEIVSSLKNQLAGLSQIEAVLYMQKSILEETREILKHVEENTRVSPGGTTLLSNNTSLIREERTYTRNSYINDFKFVNTAVREPIS